MKNTIEGNAIQHRGIKLSLGGSKRRQVIEFTSDGLPMPTAYKLIKAKDQRGVWLCPVATRCLQANSKRLLLVELADHIATIRDERKRREEVFRTSAATGQVLLI